MTREIEQTLNLIDAQVDRLVELSMRDDNAAVQQYAESMMTLSAETWKELRGITTTKGNETR